MISAYPIEKKREKRGTNVLSRSQFKIILQGRQLSSIPETHSAILASVSAQPIVTKLAGTPCASTLSAISLEYIEDIQNFC